MGQAQSTDGVAALSSGVVALHTAQLTLDADLAYLEHEVEVELVAQAPRNMPLTLPTYRWHITAKLAKQRSTLRQRRAKQQRRCSPTSEVPLLVGVALEQQQHHSEPPQTRLLASQREKSDETKQFTPQRSCRRHGADGLQGNGSRSMS